MLNIVLPIAGRGSRFREAGYSHPKPLVPVYGLPMITRVVENVRPARPHRFIFLALQEHLEATGMRGVLEAAAPGCAIVPVTQLTQGAACTVLLASDFIRNDHPLLLANSDQLVDGGVEAFLHAIDLAAADGGILTFRDSNPKWSFARIDGRGRVLQVAEKEPIGPLATVGIYHWARGSDFVRQASRMIESDLRVRGEFYVCPVFNEALAEGMTVISHEIAPGAMHGLGTPEDLDAYLALAEDEPMDRAA